MRHEDAVNAASIACGHCHFHWLCHLGRGKRANLYIPEQKTRAPRTVTKRETTPIAAKPAPTIEELNRRAYKIYLGRNGHGDTLSDWLQAERELMPKAG